MVKNDSSISNSSRNGGSISNSSRNGGSISNSPRNGGSISNSTSNHNTPRPLVAGSTRSSVDATPIQSHQEKARQRAATRDNQIRKQAGAAISKQSRPTTKHSNYPTAKRTDFSVNAVANYELYEAETILESNTIVEAARHMAAKRLDFVLVVDGVGRLVGIVTDKDVSFRVVAENLDPRLATVSQVMTRDPQCVQSSVNMIDALTKMVRNHFRHLPVMEDERIVGVLDIAKCLYDALQKLELADAAANQIAAALETVGKEFAGVIAKKQGDNNALQYADNLRDFLSSPKLSSIIGDGGSLGYLQEEQCTVVSVKCNVVQAVRQMRDRKETALLVTDEQSGALCGIFTTKDVLLRVVAAGLDPTTTTIVRVMTPHPDAAIPDTSIVSALRQMHNGHYLHLPVLKEGDKSIIGIVDVLQLTYAVLEQLSNLKGTDEAPLWHQLWSPNKTNDDGLELGSLHGTNTASQHSERYHHNNVQVAYVPPPSSSILDEFTNLPSTVVFKVKHQDEAFLLNFDILQLPSLKELEEEALKRFGLPRGTLYLLDQDEDLIPIRDDMELSRFVQMITSKGVERINVIILDRSSAMPTATSSRANDRLGLVVIGTSLALLGVGLAALGLFVLRSQKTF